jgi:hypothetical protein
MPALLRQDARPPGAAPQGWRDSAGLAATEGKGARASLAWMPGALRQGAARQEPSTAQRSAAERERWTGRSHQGWSMPQRPSRRERGDCQDGTPPEHCHRARGPLAAAACRRQSGLQSSDKAGVTAARSSQPQRTLVSGQSAIDLNEGVGRVPDFVRQSRFIPELSTEVVDKSRSSGRRKARPGP